MPKTFTAKLTLTDAGSPYSASTATPLNLSFDYTEQAQQTLEVAAAGTATVDLNAIGITPKMFMFRLTGGAGTYVVTNTASGTNTCAGNLDSAGGWVMLSSNAVAGTGLNKIVYTASSASVLEVLAYG